MEGRGVWGAPSVTLTPKFVQNAKSLNSLNMLSYPIRSSYKSYLVSEDDSNWIYYDDDMFHHPHNSIFESLPSKHEVEEAINALSQAFRDLNVQRNNDIEVSSDDGSEIDKKELTLCTYDRVYEALYSLQNDSDVQKMVKSLSTDEDFWKAIMNNEVVQELKAFSIPSVKEKALRNPSKNDSHTTRNVVIWLFQSARAKSIKVIELITKVLNALFHPKIDEDPSNVFNEKVRICAMLSIIVLLVVEVSRTEKV